jgi:ATP-dependent RNA helicase DDX52/ROK1
MQTHREFVRLCGVKRLRCRVLDKLVGGDQNIRRLDFAITTPNRLVTMLEEDKISLDGLQHFVMDEADKLFDLGFAPQLDKILSFCPDIGKGKIQLLLFTATLPSGVVELASSIMQSSTKVIIGAPDAAALEVDQELLYVGREDGKLLAMRQLKNDGRLVPPCLVFVQSRKRAQELFHELVYDKIFVDVIHAERTRAQRDAAVKAFREGRIWVLICTDLMGRGVDFKGVELVINYDFPRSAASYIHRIGRTGRAGRRGRAITFVAEEDKEYLKVIVNVMRNSGCDVPEWLLKLKKPRKRELRSLEYRPPKRRKISTAIRKPQKAGTARKPSDDHPEPAEE